MASLWWEGRRIVRLVRLALAVVLAAAVVMVIPAWIEALLPFHFMRRLAESILLGIQIFFGVALVAGTIGTVWSGALVVWTRRRQKRSTIAAYGLLFARLLRRARHGRSDCQGLERPAQIRSDTAGSRSGAASYVRREQKRRSNVGCTRRVEAAGVPYEKRLSVGTIVAWKLGEVIPTRQFRAIVLANPGDILEGQYYQLSRLRRRPDVVIVYCGHNEFYARVDWSRRVAHYPDQPPNFLERADLLGRRLSALYALIQRANDKYRIERPPCREVYTETDRCAQLHAGGIRGQFGGFPPPTG